MSLLEEIIPCVFIYFQVSFSIPSKSRSRTMSRLSIMLLIVITVVALSACNAKNAPETPAETMVVQLPVVSGNAYPLDATPASAASASESGTSEQSSENAGYPGPDTGSQNDALSANPANLVDELVLPSPVDGKAVITGQLLIAGENNAPYITTLYLASVTPVSVPGAAPLINFSRTNPAAIQEIETGRFVFGNVIPGQYTIVVWAPGQSFFLTNADGSNFIFEVKENEIKDVGVISIEK